MTKDDVQYIKFVNQEIERKTSKITDGSRLRVRSLYAIGKEYIQYVIKDITTVLAKLQTHISHHKDEERLIIGYDRKSPSNEPSEARTKSLQDMVDSLLNRALVEQLLVSISSLASDEFNNRDKNSRYNNIIKQLDHVEGNTQDSLNFISKQKKIYLVAIDYAGLSINPNDIKELIRNNESIAEIIIDNLPWKNDAVFLSRERIMDEERLLDAFDCRKACLKRSTAYSRSIKGTSIAAFEDKAAKSASRERRQARIWVQSPEKNSAIFDLEATTVSPVKFYAALSAQYPDVIGAVPVQQRSVHGTVIAFDSVEARTKACSIDVVVEGFTIIGTPTLPASSSVYPLSLDKLPIRRPNELAPLLTKVLKAYGHVLHVGLLLDPQMNLFFGKGYALLDMTTDDTHLFKPLSHEIALADDRIIYATWRGMEQHCFYCHKPGHIKTACPRLDRQRNRTCYNCGSPEHLFRSFPKRGTDRVGDKRRHEDHIDPSSLLPFHQTPVSATPSTKFTGNKASVDIDQHHLSASLNSLVGLTVQHSVTALDEPEKITEEDDSNSSYHPDDDVDDGCSVDLKETDGMSMDEEEVNELRKDQELSLVELTNARPEHTDSSSVSNEIDPRVSMATLNCRGLKKVLSSTGRSFFHTLRSLPYDILALQETHASTSELQSNFDLCLQVSSSAWTSHCGLVSFNPSLTVHRLWSSDDERLLAAEVRHISQLYDPFTVYVLYAPANRTEYRSFLQNLSNTYCATDIFTSRSVLLGDFNHNIHQPTASSTTRSWFSWLRKHWFDALHDDVNCRDLPTFTNQVSQPSVNYVRGCDHSAVSLCLSLGTCRSGPGLWRCNPNLLQDKRFCDELNSFCDGAEHHLDEMSPPVQWDRLKTLLKGFIQSYCNKAQAKKVQHQKFLQRRRRYLLRHRHTVDTTDALAHIESQLDALYDKSASTLALRSGIRWREKALYSTEPNSEDAVVTILSHVPTDVRLESHRSARLLTPWTENEVQECLKHALIHSSPGIDERLFPATWQRSVVVLLPKSGDRTQLKNWRPISLICADSKIFTRLIATRVNRLLPELINPHQTGFLRRRFITDNGLCARLTMEVAKRFQVPGIGLLLDQEKAYDRVHPSYLRSCLSHFGFPAPFVDCITQLFFGTTLCVNVNGFLSAPFPQGRGLRQGDPLSPLLFNLAVEPLLRMIIASPRLRGFTFPSLSPIADRPLLKMLAYADDVLVFLSDPTVLPSIRNKRQKLKRQ
ncbi:hypothetical protein G6F58_008601 [Rhizopus delemar]|nr:hypothetical protein G6F58_008601 [Rhizopus delemar]